MVYISGGQVQDSKTGWSLSAIPELFWGFINFIVLFFKTMVSPDLTKHGNSHTSDYRPGDTGGGPRRRMGGFRGGNSPSPPPMGGG